MDNDPLALAQDPPELALLLLPLQGNPEALTAGRRLYYQMMEGDPSSPAVHIAAMISLLVYATQTQSAGKPNGVISKQDLQTLQSELLKAVQGGDRVKQSDPETRRKIEDVDYNTKEILKRLNGGTVPQPSENVSRKWGIRVVVVALACLIGILIGQLNAGRQDEARVNRIVNALPTALRVPSTLWTHGGDISIGSLPDSDGRPISGLIIRPGTLRFGEARTTTAGSAFIPVQ